MSVKESLESGNISIDEILRDRERAWKKYEEMETKLGRAINYLIGQGLSYEQIADILICKEADVKWIHTSFKTFAGIMENFVK